MSKTGTGEFPFCNKPESENFFFFIRKFSFCGKRELENSRFVKNQNRRIFFFFYPRILVLWKTGTGEFSFGGKPEWENFFFIPEFSFCGKRELENSRFVKNQNRRIFFFLTENSRFVENGNWRILVLWKTRIGEFFFYFFFIREFSFCGKRELENSRFVENQNRGTFFFYPRILVLLKTGTGEFSFCNKPESENFFFHPRILVSWKTGTGEFSFCEKPESENFFFFLLSENSRFVETENSRFVENGNWRILVL